MAFLKKCFVGIWPINANFNIAQSAFDYSDDSVFNVCSGPVLSPKDFANLLISAKFLKKSFKKG